MLETRTSSEIKQIHSHENIETIELNTRSWLPYLHKTNSFDTIELLASGDLKQSYLNTTHQQKAIASNISTQIKNNKPDDIYDQVPRRFSQFILEQQAPKKTEKMSSMSLHSLTSSEINFPRPYNIGSNPEALASQGTIFSTRKKKSLKRSTSFKSSKSSLRRSNAIKSKNGSIWYRLKLRLKSALNKLKYKFTVSSKRSASNTSIKKKLTRKHRENPRNPSVKRALKKISAPMNNPELGIRQVEYVPTLTEELRILAGVQLGKERQISTFVDEQKDYIRKISGQVEKPLIKNNSLPKTPNCNEQSFQPSVGVPVRSSQSPVPKHFTLPKIPANKDMNNDEPDCNTLVDLWKSYLSRSLVKRIELRREITEFLTFVAQKESAEFQFENDIIIKGGKATDNSTSTSSIISADTFSTTSWETEDTASLNSSDKRFNIQLNRRSMLGDMLEYDSDNDDASSISTIISENFKNSTRNSNYSISRYGTVKRMQIV